MVTKTCTCSMATGTQTRSCAPDVILRLADQESTGRGVVQVDAGAGWRNSISSGLSQEQRGRVERLCSGGAAACLVYVMLYDDLQSKTEEKERPSPGHMLIGVSRLVAREC